MKILKFYADWCGPCKQQSKILENCSIDIESINVEENEDAAQDYDIKTLPTLVILDDLEIEIKRFNGLTPLNKIENFIKEYEQIYKN